MTWGNPLFWTRILSVRSVPQTFSHPHHCHFCQSKAGCHSQQVPNSVTTIVLERSDQLTKKMQDTELAAFLGGASSCPIVDCFALTPHIRLCFNSEDTSRGGGPRPDLPGGGVLGRRFGFWRKVPKFYWEMPSEAFGSPALVALVALSPPHTKATPGPPVPAVAPGLPSASVVRPGAGHRQLTLRRKVEDTHQPPLSIRVPLVSLPG